MFTFISVLSSGIVAAILNLILPQEVEEDEEEQDHVQVIEHVDMESQKRKEG